MIRYVRPLGRMRGVGVLFLLSLVLAGPGCEGSSNRVSGTVTFGGKPLSSGTVLLLTGDGESYRAAIESDGKFVLVGVPSGTARVAVSSLAEASPNGANVYRSQNVRERKPTATLSKIPLRYGDLSQSGLSVTVAGDTTLDLNLQ